MLGRCALDAYINNPQRCIISACDVEVLFGVTFDDFAESELVHQGLNVSK